MPRVLTPMEPRMRMESPTVSRFTGLHVHFIGIGGCGMSGLARILLDAGAIVSGSDPKPTTATNQLRQRGASISYNQTGELLSPNIDLVVRTAAIPPNNPEFLRAQQLGLPQTKYAQLLGQVMAERLGVAVSGTHGKSTTSAMIAFALLQCDADPSFVIGGNVPQLGGSSRSGNGQAFVVEACEFDRSFHNYLPKIALITNIEADHLDCYPGGIDEIIESFRVFASRVPNNGLIIANGQDQHTRRALQTVTTQVQWVGLDSPNQLHWCAIIADVKPAGYHCQILHNGKYVADLQLAVPGKHNAFNATAAIAACAASGLDPALAAASLANFTGVDRRMTLLGQFNHALVVDDYGHHPTEIRTTLRAAREKFNPNRLLCVFQPHQHSRTRSLLNDFASSFVDSDITILPDIYPARDSDEDKRSVSTTDLVERIRNHGQRAVHLPTFDMILDYLRRESRPGDLIVTMGAGNVGDIGRELVHA